MSKTKTLRQVRLLLSKVSPLSEAEKERLKAELKSGEVTIVKNKTKKK